MTVRSNLPEVIDSSISPGRLYSADEQCQQIYGVSSFYCAVSTSYTTRLISPVGDWRLRVASG